MIRNNNANAIINNMAIILFDDIKVSALLLANCALFEDKVGELLGEVGNIDGRQLGI